MMDRDIILTDKNAILDMINVLDNEFNIGYVPHIDLKCCLFRRNLFCKLDFTQHKYEYGCTCQTVKKQIEVQGYKGRYLDFKKRAEEIR